MESIKKNINLNNRIETLTGLRFIMIMMIVISHLEFLKCDDKLQDFYTCHLWNAKMAVHFFFIMSGFGLTYASIKHQENFQYYNYKCCIKYAIKRIKKIYPLYIVTMGIMFANVIYTKICLEEYLSIFKQTILFIFTGTLLQSATGMTMFSHAFNGACWFLSTLTILYIIYPKIGRANNLLIIKRETKSLFLILIVLILSYPIIRYIFEQIDKNTFFNDLAYGSPYMRIFDIIIGVILCDIYIYRKHNAKIIKLSEIPVFICFIFWWLFRNTIFCINEYNNLKTFIDISITAIVVLVYSYQIGIISKFLESRIMVKLGNMAMYIYLIHYPVRMLLDYYLSPILIKYNISQSWLVLPIVIATIMCIYITLLIKNVKTRNKYISH